MNSMSDQKENMMPTDSFSSSSSSTAAANNYNNSNNSIGANGTSGMKMSLDLLHAQRIVRFGENEHDIFMLKDDDTTRAQLVEKLKADPTSPDKWLDLFKAPPSYDAKSYSKTRLYRRATTFMPKDKWRHVKSYVEIWIRFAQVMETEKEKRDTFKYMKSERIGERETMFYDHYAAFEYQNGNHLEADEILSLGVRNSVFTTNDKDAMYARLASGQLPVLRSSTSHSTSQQRLMHTPRDLKSSHGKRAFSTPSGESTMTMASHNGSTMTTPSATTTHGTFSTARKAALMTTPSMAGRPSATAQSSRKATTPASRFFNLGGPPLRVIASTTPGDDPFKASNQSERFVDSDDDDDEDMGMSDGKPTLSPIGETKTSTSLTATHTPAASGAARKPTQTTPGTAANDLSYIKNWAPRPLSSMSSSSKAPSFDHNNKDLYPSPKRQNLGGGGQAVLAASDATTDRGASGPQIRLDPLSPMSVGSSASSPRSLTDGSSNGSGGVPRDPFASLSTKVTVNGLTYIKLEQIGSGGSSKVYRMLGPDLKIYALKKIKLKRLDPQSIEQYTNEIQLLQRLQGNPFIIRLIAAEQDIAQRAINVMMEHGEIDLGERLREMKDGLDENFLRVIWTQMLQAVHAIHTERIIHGDLKPANFLFVNGALKLIDFGIAKAISNDTTNIERDSQVGTVNFMSPEAIQGNAGPGGQRNPQGKMKVGRASDIWSLGCILYQVVYGKPPFADLNSIIEKFRCIIDPSYEIPFPSLLNKELEDVIRKCLQRDHRARPTIDGVNGLLSHPFLRNNNSSGSSGPLSVTLANGSAVLDQLAALLKTRGVESSKLATFVAIGQDGLASGSHDTSSRYRPKRDAYKYDTQERQTEM